MHRMSSIVGKGLNISCCCRWQGSSEQHCSAEHMWPVVSLHQCSQELAKLVGRGPPTSSAYNKQHAHHTSVNGMTAVHCCRWQRSNHQQFCCAEYLWSDFRLHQCPQKLAKLARASPPQVPGIRIQCIKGNSGLSTIKCSSFVVLPCHF